MAGNLVFLRADDLLDTSKSLAKGSLRLIVMSWDALLAVFYLYLLLHTEFGENGKKGGGTPP
jgi:hypothetical protein